VENLMRRILLPCCLAAAIGAVAGSAKGPRFYDDDPIARAPESQDASGAQPIDISLLYEYAFNLIADGSRTVSAAAPSRKPTSFAAASSGVRLRRRNGW
jgi:hypothetical protein